MHTAKGIAAFRSHVFLGTTVCGRSDKRTPGRLLSCIQPVQTAATGVCTGWIQVVATADRVCLPQLPSADLTAGVFRSSNSEDDAERRATTQPLTGSNERKAFGGFAYRPYPSRAASIHTTKSKPKIWSGPCWDHMAEHQKEEDPRRVFEEPTDTPYGCRSFTIYYNSAPGSNSFSQQAVGGLAAALLPASLSTPPPLHPSSTTGINRCATPYKRSTEVHASQCNAPPTMASNVVQDFKSKRDGELLRLTATWLERGCEAEDKSSGHAFYSSEDVVVEGGVMKTPQSMQLKTPSRGPKDRGQMKELKNQSSTSSNDLKMICDDKVSQSLWPLDSGNRGPSAPSSSKMNPPVESRPGGGGRGGGCTMRLIEG
ncbi:hypothetical protein EYF80_000136 [Liparis tanakae]|uniref:Uncharacterized protein n=1 Tax=Liparis tanakae TaxID=230148 RepID=A0A4Z2JI91_9TELE|nr:hypothetical protein EYF80_000136 [Liparis tanakae]